MTAAAAIDAGRVSARCTSSITGVPYFVDSDIPSAVFLGLHLLVTDPSTSPRTPLGRAIFGVCYGVGVFGLYSLLGALGMPTFYDKLLCVPLLNLAVPAIDRAVKTIGPSDLLHRLALDGPLGRGNLAHMAVWVAFFALHDHDGRGRRHAQGRLAAVLGAGVRRGQAERVRAVVAHRSVVLRRQRGLGVQRAGPPSPGRHGSSNAIRIARLLYFSRACEGRFQAGLRQPARRLDDQP